MQRIVIIIIFIALALGGCSEEASKVEVLKQTATKEIAIGLRYREYAERAAAEGYSNIARMFESVHHGEMYQSGAIIRILRSMGEEFSPRVDSLESIGSTRENLYSAKASEEYSTEVIYPEVIEDFSGDTEILNCYSILQRSDSVHRELFIRAIEILESKGSDSTLSADWRICTRCGSVAAGAGFVSECEVCK
ncbi:MAG: ferritin family protein [Rikenellaceae bacterium]